MIIQNYYGLSLFRNPCSLCGACSGVKVGQLMDCMVKLPFSLFVGRNMPSKLPIHERFLCFGLACGT